LKQKYIFHNFTSGVWIGRKSLENGQISQIIIKKKIFLIN
jgi:hypothetical protein